MPRGELRRVDVLIASYRRPDDLMRCLRALDRQNRPPDDIIIVLRDNDAESRLQLVALADRLPTVRLVSVAEPGVITARNKGLELCRGDVVAMLDDDTAPHPDWLARIVAHFAGDHRLGGLGGRDRCHDGRQFDERQAKVVGRLTWYGRPTGNHHLGHGRPREVDFLKGANMSFRREAIAGLQFDTRLRGFGAGPHEDFAFSLAVRRQGWRLLYDPAVVVDHFPGYRDEPRHYAAVHRAVDAAGFRNHTFNLTVALWETLRPLQRLAYATWLALAGTGICPGLLHAVWHTPRLGCGAWRRFLLAQQGAFAAYLAMLGPGQTSAMAADGRRSRMGATRSPVER